MTNEERLSHVSSWRASGLPRPVYCKTQGLKYSTFMKWCKEEPFLKGDKGQFISVSPVVQVGIDIKFPNGIELSYQGGLTVELIKMLQDA